MMWIQNLGMGGSEVGAPVAPGPGRELMLLYVGRIIILALVKGLLDFFRLGVEEWLA